MIIYCATNIVNNKIYVGKTIQSLADRWKSHVNMANSGRNIYFYNAIRKYGDHNFKLSVLETASSEEHLNELECKWIRELNSASSKIGYNSTYGGEGFSSGYKNPSVINPRRGKDNHSFGVPVSPEIRKKISTSLTSLLVGEKNPFYGKKHSEETRKKIGDIQRGKTRKPHSESTREKIRQRMLKRTFSSDTLEKMAQAKRGKPLSEEHKTKLREAQTRRREREAAQLMETA